MTPEGQKVILVLYRSRRMLASELKRALDGSLLGVERRLFEELEVAVLAEVDACRTFLETVGLMKPEEPNTQGIRAHGRN